MRSRSPRAPRRRGACSKAGASTPSCSGPCTRRAPASASAATFAAAAPRCRSSPGRRAGRPRGTGAGTRRRRRRLRLAHLPVRGTARATPSARSPCGEPVTAGSTSPLGAPCVSHCGLAACAGSEGPALAAGASSRQRAPRRTSLDDVRGALGYRSAGAGRYARRDGSEPAALATGAEAVVPPVGREGRSRGGGRRRDSHRCGLSGGA